MKISLSALVLLMVIAGSTFTGCGRGGAGRQLTADSFTVGGTVAGLNGTVVLVLNGSEQLQITSSGSYSFTTTLADGAAYVVTVFSHPTSQTIALSNASGTISGDDVSNIDVALADMSWVHPSSLSDNISPDGGSANNPRIAMGDNGDAVVVWAQMTGGVTQAFMSDYRNGVWTHPADLSDYISPGTTYVSYPQAAMDENGNTLLVWYQSDGSFRQIYVSEYRGGAWTHPAGLSDNISNDGPDSEYAQVAMSDNGEAIIVWSQRDGSAVRQIFKSEYRGGTWTHPASLTENISPDGQDAFYPQVAMDDSGNAIIAWMQSDGTADQAFMSEYRSGTWTHPADLTDSFSPDGQDTQIPRVAMDNDGKAVIVWAQHDGSEEQIYLSESRSGTWSHPADLTDTISTSGGEAEFPRLSMDDDGNTVVVWHQHDGVSNQIFMSEYRGGAWTHPADLSDSISPDGTDAQYTHVTLSDHGNAVATWHQFEGSQNAIFKSEYHDGAWTHPANLTEFINPPGDDARYSRVMSDGNGKVLLFWIGQNGGSDYEVFKSEFGT